MLLGGEAVGAEGLAEDGERAVAGEDAEVQIGCAPYPLQKGEGQAVGEPAPPAGQWCRHFVQVRKPQLVEYMP